MSLFFLISAENISSVPSVWECVIVSCVWAFICQCPALWFRMVLTRNIKPMYGKVLPHAGARPCRFQRADYISDIKCRDQIRQHFAMTFHCEFTRLAKSSNMRPFGVYCLSMAVLCVCAARWFSKRSNTFSFYCYDSILFSCFITLAGNCTPQLHQKQSTKQNRNQKKKAQIRKTQKNELYCICAPINYIFIPKRAKYLNGASYCFCCRTAAVYCRTDDGNSVDREMYPYGRIV